MSSLNFLRNSLQSAAASASMAETQGRTGTFGTGLGIFSDAGAAANASTAPTALGTEQSATSASSPNPSYQPAGQTNLAFAAPDAGFQSTAAYMNKTPQQYQANAIDYYVLHVQASFNNTLVTITNHQGDAVAMSSGGKAGFKKANRAGYEPAYQATRQVLTKLETKLGDTAHTFGVKAVEDVTPVAHGGCRPRKARRL
ncbi:hypothetical protein BCR44DRAFT_1498041 [Catenaria anguillulae PL171]|uniref:Ribosomal protein S11-domain-containing protein n=1 Tax=Catenaria anguillulae PL171 TaxID=765915 RepID=A0A1Y2HSM2_9FUNG|nr:hypothetical protein BCR44DRAFT_1498041 [Catenaria anguillulae PL171]